MTLTEGQKQSLKIQISELERRQQYLKYMGSCQQHFSKNQEDYYRKANDIETQIQTLKSL